MASSVLVSCALAPAALLADGAAGRTIRSNAAPSTSAALGAFSAPALAHNGTPSRRLLPLPRGGSSSLRVRAGPNESDSAEEILAVEENAMEKMEKTLESVKGNFNTVRTGRANPSLLDRVEVEYYGAQVTLKSIAQISTPDGASLLITPFDKSSIQAIEKAIMKSDIGLTPSSDGTVIRLSIPQLTSERRKELLKTVSKLAEDGKVALRNVRRDAIKAYDKLEKDKKMSEDDKKGYADSLQKLTDDYVKQVETMFKSKEKELSTV